MEISLAEIETLMRVVIKRCHKDIQAYIRVSRGDARFIQ